MINILCFIAGIIVATLWFCLVEYKHIVNYGYDKGFKRAVHGTDNIDDGRIK